MRGVSFILLFFIGLAAYAQQAYYEGIDFRLPPEQLFLVLQEKLEDYKSSYTYGAARDMMKVTDAWEEDISRVVLIYGYNDQEKDCTSDYTRDKNIFGGQACEYNREHVFAKSLANPPMGQSNNNTIGIAADPHNIRACDQRANQIRGNKRFGPGSGNARVIGKHWYPGDEWKGDVARMMMYMFVRYGDRCLPSLVGEGATQDSNDMLALFIKWNVEDPISYLEIQRNDHIEKIYGSRNPFIDNPHLATLLWGGEVAEDKWGLFSDPEYHWEESLTIYSEAKALWVETTTKEIEFTYTLYDFNGKEIISKKSTKSSKQAIPIDDLPTGVYILNIKEANKSVNKQLIIE